MATRLGIGIVAPSSKVPAVEFAMGVERLKQEGFQVFVHPQCRKSYLFFAGQDEERAQAFFEYAHDPRISVVWCARGGHGALRVLPILDRLASEQGIPSRKLLVGYSDATALLEYVRVRWGWSVLHAPMPGARSFSRLPSRESKPLFEWVRGHSTPMPWGKKKLKFVGNPPRKEIRGEIFGGNLTVWAALLGTSFAPGAHRKSHRILFFEDVGESLYRLDRFLVQLQLSGAIQGARAIVLGNFEGCEDHPPGVLAKLGSEKLEPLRKKLDPKRMIPRIFGEIGASCGVPVAYGLPVGHGPDRAPLPYGEYRLGMDGSFELLNWDWIE